MLSEHDRETSLKSAFSPIEKWIKKLFRIKSANPDTTTDRRDFYRLPHDKIQPLDLCLTMQDEQVFCTTIEDLSASGFSCRLIESGTIRCGEPMSALFVLPLDEPVIIRTEVFLMSIVGNEDARLFRFRYYDEMSDDDRELIHRYIVQKQFEIIQNKGSENWHEESEEGFSTGD
ncbi:MAG: c-di-GMP-binding flagellar brake protein YcgR [Nitrospinales bacterium]|jgi:c-di-GMP-binding flagellar brake protein YcgR